MRLSEAIELLSKAGIKSARDEARALFCHFEGLPYHRLIGEDPDSTTPNFAEAIERRTKREPLQYIIGEVEFFRERYKVTKDCLIPRSDTELLVEYAVANLQDGARVLDLCCGSGCIAISTVANTKNTSAVALDISDAALDIAKYNAKLNKVEGRVEFLQLDVLHDPLPIRGKFDAVLSNPPYVKDEVYKTLEKEIFYEPQAAFVGGEDGGDFYRAITPIYKDLLAESGFIAYEIGYDQSDLITAIATEWGMTSEILRDLSGNPRVAVLKNKN